MLCLFPRSKQTNILTSKLIMCLVMHSQGTSWCKKTKDSVVTSKKWFLKHLGDWIHRNLKTTTSVLIVSPLPLAATLPCERVSYLLRIPNERDTKKSCIVLGNTGRPCIITMTWCIMGVLYSPFCVLLLSSSNRRVRWPSSITGAVS